MRRARPDPGGGGGCWRRCQNRSKDKEEDVVVAAPLRASCRCRWPGVVAMDVVLVGPTATASGVVLLFVQIFLWIALLIILCCSSALCMTQVPPNQKSSCLRWRGRWLVVDCSFPKLSVGSDRIVSYLWGSPFSTKFFDGRRSFANLDKGFLGSRLMYQARLQIFGTATRRIWNPT